MRRSIFVGVVVACLVIVGTAVALAQQPSQGSGQVDEGLRSFHDEMHAWMTDNWDEMPMFGGSTSKWMTDNWDETRSWMTDNWDEMPMYGGFVGEDGWAQSPDEMHSWMTDNWDETPMSGGSTSEWMTENWNEMPMHGGGSRG